jgi:hypothetical protein
MNFSSRISFAFLSVAVIGIIFSQISQYYLFVEGRDLGNFKSKNKPSQAKFEPKDIKHDKSSKAKFEPKDIKHDKSSKAKFEPKDIKHDNDHKGSDKKQPDCVKRGSCIGGGPDNINHFPDKKPVTDGKRPSHNPHINDIENVDFDIGDIENVDFDIGDIENVDINVDDVDDLNIDIDDLDIDADDVHIDCDDCHYDDDDDDDDDDNGNDVTYVYQTVYPQSQPVMVPTAPTSTGSPIDVSASNNVNKTSIQSYVTAKINDIIKSGTFKVTSISPDTVINPVNDSGLALIGSALGVNNIGWISDGIPNQVIVLTGLSDDRTIRIVDNTTNVQLADPEVTLGKNDLLALGYLSQINDWVQIASKIT